jgi:hypothetical protein
MTVKKLGILIPLILLFSKINAQRSSAKYDDGTEINYELLETQADKTHRLRIVFGTEYTSLSLLELRGNYLLPGKFNISSYLGYSAIDDAPFVFGISGTYFLRSTEKKLEESIRLRSVSEYMGHNSTTIKNYTTSIDYKAGNYFGIHGGFEKNERGNNPLAISLIAGAGFYHVKHYKFFVEGEGSLKSRTQRRTRTIGAYADVIAFTGIDPSTVPKDPSDPTKMVDYSPIGAQVYIEGTRCGQVKRDFGIHYRIGGGIGAVGPFAILGLGLYAGF